MQVFYASSGSIMFSGCLDDHACVQACIHASFCPTQLCEHNILKTTEENFAKFSGVVRFGAEMN